MKYKDIKIEIYASESTVGWKAKVEERWYGASVVRRDTVTLEDTKRLVVQNAEETVDLVLDKNA